ncbi:hypothetical protein PSN45_001101 [Yamadazyma tenuis]|uniref:Ubiquitin-like domain-containing protein n=1 Tax=Candida tenuis (strain ATCC 10573 / BCRC 21748 / CBS 615 / JCM 9827 / NBRC 10315 / NRRL Y-1498 / VKM Y-70) TaxID=590646 RepID=G3B8C9_CANTC|nr:uncharacterized protein CANTEDRAFT_136296 [Yamadazyma tenuis ATCC 10573]EGV62367.1 hypothetical protein CANTEDRAFT_136296 [Yamadazyma tenuis ATCC 10573]WEJ93632.1 hypothetical protein PSN45_001101 [Yamadazyma tenuis]
MSATIVIRFIDSKKGEAIPDYEITDLQALSYQRLKHLIRSNNSYCTNKRLKLIYNGRVLNEHFDFKGDLISKFSESSLRIYVHCVIGEDLTKEQLRQESLLDNQEIKRTTQPEIIGFDRLLQQGFSQQDVDDLRAQFERIYNINQTNSQINDLEEEEQRQEYLRQLEERWINSTVNADGTSTRPAPEAAGTEQVTADAPANHTIATTDVDDTQNEDLLIGLLVGVFLGVIGVLFVVADDSVFDKRQRMAIIVGMFINISLAIIRGQWI